jgi:hypothetical protein
MSRIDKGRYRTRRVPGALRSSAILCAALLVWVPCAAGGEPLSVGAQQPMRDPWVPPESRPTSVSPPTEGAALRAQVERKLKQAFDAADVNQTGSLTRRQASAAGLGFVARHFDEIDRHRSGVIRFDDVKRYLVEHGAQLN